MKSILSLKGDKLTAIQHNGGCTRLCRTSTDSSNLFVRVHRFVFI